MNALNPGLKIGKITVWCVGSWLLVFMPSTIMATAALAAAEGTGVNPSGLWQKALAVYQKNNDLIPGKMEVVSELLDRRGRPGSVSKFYFKIIVDDQGKAHSELTQAFRDNRDVSVEMKKRMEIRDAEQEKNSKNKETLTISMGDNPFNPDKQKNVKVHAHAEKQLLFGRMCRRFDFSFKADIGRKNQEENPTWVGKAWLEESSGIPVKLEFSFEPLPKHVNSLWTIYRYEINDAGDWFLKEIMVQGRGGFLFIKKGFRSSTRFSDYRRWPPKEHGHTNQ